MTFQYARRRKHNTMGVTNPFKEEWVAADGIFRPKNNNLLYIHLFDTGSGNVRIFKFLEFGVEQLDIKYITVEEMESPYSVATGLAGKIYENIDPTVFSWSNGTTVTLERLKEIYNN